MGTVLGMYRQAPVQILAPALGPENLGTQSIKRFLDFQSPENVILIFTASFIHKTYARRFPASFSTSRSINLSQLHQKLRLIPKRPDLTILDPGLTLGIKFHIKIPNDLRHDQTHFR